MVYHIPVCPFSQRLEILLALKGLTGAVDFTVVDITKPRPPDLQRKMRNTTSLPVLEDENGRILKESLVLLRYFEHRFPEPRVARADPYEHALENMLIAFEGDFTTAGYLMVMNQDPAKRGAFEERMFAQYDRIEDFLAHHAPDGPWLFDDFGLAETIFTPMFRRFAFLGYYENFDLPEDHFPRVRDWRAACLAHPAAQQVSDEEVVKLYYDYARGAGNGALPPGRRVSSFAFEPHWRDRPMPPRDKYGDAATDAELGLAA